MKILLVEDEEAIRGFVRINLKRADMEPVEAGSAEQALRLVAEQGPPDIALLDIMLPGLSGLELCSALREAYPEMGIIMLTAKSQEQDKIEALELGADDYIQKPFSPGELMARIRSLQRRMNIGAWRGPAPAAVAAPEAEGEAAAARTAAMPAPAEAEAHGAPAPSAAAPAPASVPASAAVRSGEPFRLAPGDRRLWKHDREIVLTPTEWSLVKLLLERRGQSVSRDEILSEVWGRYYVGDLKVVDVNIRRIRQKVEDDPSEPAIIETVWGFGYRWNRSDPG
ncbi:response regulator transcription factor [Paenibacillus sp. B01]|uniref:response regulator transcription factor n=1 Tax=Paenibacillus sp. B01 TaxID=2660554 RepID=UPI00129A10DB|nr:response regulator transcription factor [Paenibacillus sp. B01]QGG57852.1 response regulator [Paenibacillus sp. B01]